MNRKLIKSILQHVAVIIHLAVPFTAVVVVVLTIISPTIFTQDILLQILLALVAGIAVSETILRFGTLNEIARNVKNIAEISNLQLLQSARESGVVDLSPRANITWRQDIANEIYHCDGILDLCGVGLPKFRDEDFLRSSLAEVSTKYDVRILLLNPNSEEARRRAEIEKPLGRKTIEDIKTTIIWVQQQQALNRRFRLHLYNLPPMLALVITDQFAFVEPYHFGRPEGLEGCIGGHVPMLKIRNSPELGVKNQYSFFKAHFNYLWQNTHGMRVNLPIQIINFNPSTSIIFENQTEFNISMNGWELSGQGCDKPYRFDPEFVWEKGMKVFIGTLNSNITDIEKFYQTDINFMGDNTILTLTNALGTVVSQWSISKK